MVELRDIKSVFDVTEQAIAGVKSDQAKLPTPCSKYDVADLIKHTIGTAGFLLSAVLGEAPVGNGDDNNTSPAQQFRGFADKMIDAWSKPDAFAGTVKLGEHDVPATRPFELSMVEFFTHAWDFAKATGQVLHLDPHLARSALAISKKLIKPSARSDDGEGFFAHPIAASEEASDIDKLVAFLGRDPNWTA